MGDDAYHGLAGEVVHTIEPHTEAHSVALLLQFLNLAGNVMGRTAYYQVEGDHHHTNLFAVVVAFIAATNAYCDAARMTFSGRL